MVRESNIQYLSDGIISCSFDRETGKLLAVKGDSMDLRFDGITADVGCNGEYLLNSLIFDSFERKNTWELPVINPRSDMKQPAFNGFTTAGEKLFAHYDISPVQLEMKYEIVHGALKVSLKLTNVSEGDLWLNGVAFILHLDRTDVKFDFPANVPHHVFEADRLTPWKAVQTGLISSAVHTEFPGGHFNLLFADPIEKWGTGVYLAENTVNYAFVPAVEEKLGHMEVIECEGLYIQPVSGGNPYLRIRDYFEQLGYRAATGGITSGIMYSCHPAGTMDKNFPLKNNLFEYAEYLETLKDMGIDHVWLLPIFEHLDRGVYHSTDQAIIDERYGGDEGARHLSKRAHELGMTVLYDYVPHGPHPDDPLALKTQDWCSRRMDGSLQIEWECVSYDYNNPGYQKYTTDLVKDHVDRFGVDGARIDCAMGGLSNWRPCKGERPSGNSVRAGVNITRATRDGFLLGGKQSFILPENFNPIPFYYPYTDIFYGFNLYRVLCELDSIIHSDPAEYVRQLTRWLETEKLAMPLHFRKLRFLGNHDTVSWVFQASRAVKYYGEDAAKALWAVMTFIDGMPMIYQGDEDPVWYGSEGPVLKDFFKNLFAARKKWIGDGDEIEYLHTGTPIMAFIRTVGQARRLVLVNLAGEPVEFRSGILKSAKPLIGNTPAADERAILRGFGYEIYEIG